jgi:hypothetical protein
MDRMHDEHFTCEKNDDVGGVLATGVVPSFGYFSAT